MIRNPRQLHLMRLGLPVAPLNGSGGGSTTSTTNSAPWVGQQPYLNNLFSQAYGTYSNYLQNPATAAVAGFTPMQNQAMGETQNVANGTNFNNASGLNNSAASYTTNLLNGNYLNSNPGNAAFSQFANGSMMNNPYESGALDAANNAITRAYQTATAPQTSSAFEGAGRYGSGANANAVSQNQQDLATQLGNTDAGLVNSMYQQNMGNMLQGAQGLSSNYNTAAQQQLQGSYNAPNLVNSINGAATNLYNMGGNQQALNQAYLNAPWQQLGNFSNLIQGQYGGTTNSSQPYYTNQTAGALGGAASGAAMGSMFGPWGTAIGGIGGGLLGAFSDRRLKKNIELTDEKLENGLPIYRYRYQWESPLVRRFGVMADEVRRVRPDAVHTHASGFDMVDYNAIGAGHVG